MKKTKLVLCWIALLLLVGYAGSFDKEISDIERLESCVSSSGSHSECDSCYYVVYGCFPSDWEEHVVDGDYSFGYYRAIEL